MIFERTQTHSSYTPCSIYYAIFRILSIFYLNPFLILLLLSIYFRMVADVSCLGVEGLACLDSFSIACGTEGVSVSRYRFCRLFGLQGPNKIPEQYTYQDEYMYMNICIHICIYTYVYIYVHMNKYAEHVVRFNSRYFFSLAMCLHTAWPGSSSAASLPAESGLIRVGGPANEYQV